jgi:hypothetical protein
MPNIQFFLDIDADVRTGNLDEGGADYMVENGYLYASTSNSGWSWKEIAKVKSVIDDGKSDTIAIKLSDLKNKSVVFRVSSHALDDSWISKVNSPSDGTKSTYSSKDINIDWDKILPYSTTSDKDVKLFNNKDNFYINISEDKFSPHTQVYIDIDNNSKSGFSSDSWSNFGRDFLVEDGYLYRYAGKDGSWDWELVDTIQRVRTESKNEKDMMTITIPKSKLGKIADNIKVAVEVNSEDWSNTTFIPDGNIKEYELKSSDDDVHKYIEISEVMASNSHTILDPDYFSFSDWIELHNKGDKVINISGYQISDKLNIAKWTIPSKTTIAPGGYLLLWADKKDKKKKALHTNFKLKAKGGAVALFDRSGRSVDAFEYLKQAPDISVRAKNNKLVYMQPSPQKANKTEHASAIHAKEVTFSKKSGFYNQIEVALSAKGTIYYTTDGSIPTTSSQKYKQPIVLNETGSIRAISVENGKFTSKVATESYIIGENNINMPVISISVDDKYLYDAKIGIYTEGTNGKTLPCGEEGEDITANFFQKWERPAHMVFFEENKKVVLSQDIGLKVSGTCSRVYNQKSFQLKADGKYGDKSFDYKVFPDKKIKKYKKLKLRNAGQDIIKTRMRDTLAHLIVKDKMHLDYEAYRPAVVFLNGEYWGVYSLREKMGKDYLKENYGVKKVDLIEDDSIAKEGSSQEYDELMDFVRTHSLSVTSNYNHVLSKIDIDNYIDYMITNIYIGNSDWPGTNLMYWKEQKAGKKWKWHLHDMDFAFGRYSQNPVESNTLKVATTVSDEEWPNPEWSTLLLRKLLENSSFKSKFKNRFISQIDTTFKADRVNAIVDSITSKTSPQMQRHINRWTIDGKYSYAVNSKDDWDYQVGKVKTYLKERPSIVKSHLNGL